MIWSFHCLPNRAWAAANLASLAWNVDDMVRLPNLSQPNIVADLMGHPVFHVLLVNIFLSEKL